MNQEITPTFESLTSPVIDVTGKVGELAVTNFDDPTQESAATTSTITFDSCL